MRPGRSGNKTAILLLVGGAACAGAFVFGRARNRPAEAPVVEAPATAQDKNTEPTPQVEQLPSPAASTLAGTLVAPANGAPRTPEPEKPANDALAKAFADADAGLAKEDDPGPILALRKLAVERAKTPEGKRAQARLAELVDQSQKAAKAAGTDAYAERNALSRAFLATLVKKDRKPFEERINELNKSLVFSNKPTPDGDLHVVKAGDKLITIARARKTTWTFVKRVNGLKSEAIRVGQKLKIPTTPVSVVVFKDDFQIVLLMGARVLRAFDVGTGREDRTPEGTFTIAERLSEPTWYAPDGKVYPFGTKENILGTRWLGFSRTEQVTGFGIHGTAYPETIGTPSSAGCIRMRNEEVEEVFDFVGDGATVTIQR